MMTKKDLMEMLAKFEDDAMVVIAEPYYDPYSGHHQGDHTYDIKKIEEDKKEIKLYFR